MELPLHTRQQAQSTVIHFQRHNGVSIALSVGQVLSLLALFYGANDSQMGWVFTGIHLTGFFNLLGPYIFRGWYLKSVFSFCWFLKAFVGLGYLALPFITSDYRVWALLAIFYLYMSIRAIGFSTFSPLLQSITSSKDRPSFMARNIGTFNLTFMFGSLVAYLTMRFQPFDSQLSNFHFLLIVGFLFAMTASLQLKKLPKTEIINVKKGESLLTNFRFAIESKDIRQVIILTAFQTSLMAFSAYKINFLKNSVGFDMDYLFLIGFIGLALGVIINKILQLLGNHIRRWSLLVGSHVFILLGAIPFSLTGHYLSPDYSPIFLFLIIISSIGDAGSLTIMLQLQTDNLPSKNALGINIIYQLTVMVAALLSVGAIYLIEYYNFTPVGVFHRYSPHLLISSGICLAIIFMGARLEGVRDTFKELLLVSPQGLWTLARTTKANQTVSPASTHVIEGLLTNRSNLSRKLLKEYLVSSDHRKRYAALRSICSDPTTHEIEGLLPLVIAQANAPGNLLRHEALTALGFLKSPDSLNILREALKSEDVSVSGAAIKSLCRLGEEGLEEDIVALYRKHRLKAEAIHLMIAALETKNIQPLTAILEIEISHRSDDSTLKTLTSLIASRYKQRDEIIDIFDSITQDINLSLELLSDILNNDSKAAITAIKNEDFDTLTTIFKTQGKENWQPWNRVSAIAMLYVADHVSV